MNESVNMESDTLSKSDDNIKCISQKSVKFSIDSLLANNETVTNKSDLNVIEGSVCSDFNNCSQIENVLSDSEKNPTIRHFSELSSTAEGTSNSEVVSTTEGFYQKNFTEGMLSEFYSVLCTDFS